MRRRRTEVQRRAVDVKALKFRGAQASDYERLVEEDEDVLVGGELVVAFRMMKPADVWGLRNACNAIEFQNTARTDGLVTESRTFGSLPRVTLRRDFCTKASMATQHPAQHEVLCEYARKADAVYRATNPGRYAHQEQAVSAVLPEWRIPGTAFTSGIANRNNTLRYHRDSGNFKGLWSAMYALCFDTEGGVLAMPELGLGFSFQKPALIMFDGADVAHGVTPIVRRSSMSYRYSVVFYAMKAMCNCLPMADELLRIQRVKTKRAVDRAAEKKV